MISESYVGEFLPIHEIDNLGPNTHYSQEGELVLVDLSSDDLFLVSKLCSEANDTENSIMISKSLRYGDLRDKISDDYGIQIMKDNIHEISCNLCEFSCDMYQKQIPKIYSTINTSCTYLCDDYRTRINYVSGTFIPEVSGNLTSLVSSISTSLDNKKTDKQKSAIISSLSDGYFIKSFEFDDQGHIKQLTKANIDQVSKYLVIDGKKVSSGTIAGDVQDMSVLTLTNATTSSIYYQVQEDCYMTIAISVLENDSCNKPMEVWLHNSLSGEPVEMRLCQFNNPGGFSGVKYYNYYFEGFPIKQVNTTEGVTTIKATSVYIKYSDNSKFLYDSSQKSIFEFREHPFYATVSKSDISGFVRAVDTTSEAPLNLYAISVNRQGLVLDHILCSMTNIATEIPTPTSDQAGTIKTGKANNQTDKLQTLGVRVDDDKNAYVQLSTASNSQFGTVKTGDSDDNVSESQSHDVRIYSSGKAYVNVQSATTSTYGTVKTNDGTQYTAADTFLRIPVEMDDEGKLWAKIKRSKKDESNNYVALRILSEEDSQKYDGDLLKYVHANVNEFGYISLTKATNGKYGIVKLGNSSTNGDVYADIGDGHLKCNASTDDCVKKGETIRLNSYAIINDANDGDRYIRICGGTDENNGASLLFMAKGYDHPEWFPKGSFTLYANDGSSYYALQGCPDGTLTWNNEKVISKPADFVSYYINYTETQPTLVYSSYFTGIDLKNGNYDINGMFFGRDDIDYYLRVIFTNTTTSTRKVSITVDEVTNQESLLGTKGAQSTIDVLVTYKSSIKIDNVATSVNVSILVYTGGFPEGINSSTLYLVPGQTIELEEDRKLYYSCPTVKNNYETKAYRNGTNYIIDNKKYAVYERDVYYQVNIQVNIYDENETCIQKYQGVNKNVSYQCYKGYKVQFITTAKGYHQKYYCPSLSKKEIFSNVESSYDEATLSKSAYTLKKAYLE